MCVSGRSEGASYVFMRPCCALSMAGVCLRMSGRVQIAWLRKKEVGACNGMNWWCWFQGAAGLESYVRATEVKLWYLAFSLP